MSGWKLEGAEEVRRAWVIMLTPPGGDSPGFRLENVVGDNRGN